MLADAPIGHHLFSWGAMHKIGTAIVASTIFIGPIAGAVLPFLAVGYGVYWLVGRCRKANGPSALMRAEAAEVPTNLRQARRISGHSLRRRWSRQASGEGSSSFDFWHFEQFRPKRMAPIPHATCR